MPTAPLSRPRHRRCYRARSDVPLPPEPLTVDQYHLPEKCIEQYTRPLPTAARYASAETLTAKQSLTLPLPQKKSLKLSVASRLP